MKNYKRILDFYKSLDSDWDLPSGVELIFPFKQRMVIKYMNTFYRKFYNDSAKRYLLFGINPGRLGAGMTGIPFTDPIHLNDHCGISNVLDLKHELSSKFIYEIIEAYGGTEQFYKKYYITSLCPLGFLKDSKNFNYYDSPELFNAVKKHIVNSVEQQLEIPCFRDKAYSIGQGKNFEYFKKLNDKHNWFDEIIPLPHPRWVLQYKRKTKEKYIAEYLEKLS